MNLENSFWVINPDSVNTVPRGKPSRLARRVADLRSSSETKPSLTRPFSIESRLLILTTFPLLGNRPAISLLDHRDVSFDERYEFHHLKRFCEVFVGSGFASNLPVFFLRPGR